MPDIHDVVEESAIDRFYVYRGHKGARAIELVYDGCRVVINESSRSHSLVTAKLVLRAYKASEYYSKGRHPPFDRWATLTPVFAETREEELRLLLSIDRLRFGSALKKV